jgi:hypothetical protein
MSPNDVFVQMPESTCTGMLADLFENEKPLYKNLIENLAKQRKLRPVFIERKPRNERFAWIKDALGRKQNEPIAANLLQIWLVSRHPKMLCDFLDSLGIKHDDNGTVEQIPPQPEKPALEAAVHGLLEKYDASIVAVYLHAFQALDETGWPLLDEIIAAEPRAQLADQKQQPSPAPVA